MYAILADLQIFQQVESRKIPDTGRGYGYTQLRWFSVGGRLPFVEQVPVLRMTYEEFYSISFRAICL